MSEIRQLIGFVLIFAGIFGIAMTLNVSAVAQAALKAYPMSIKTPEQKISPTLAAVSKEKTVSVVIVLTAPSEMAVAQQAAVVPQLQMIGFKKVASITAIDNAVIGEVPADKLQEIAQNPYVDQILADTYIAELSSDVASIHFLDTSVKLIGADKVWATGNTGQGVTVIEIDSGIQNNHPALIRDGRSLVIEEYSAIDTPADYTEWHGTHVAGIIASQNPTYKGVALGINGFVDIIAFDANGNAKLSWIMKALDYAYQAADKYRPSVCTNSWGIYPPINTPEINKIRELVAKLAKKVPVVFAAGNKGMYGGGTITAPADVDDVITVGAVDDTFNIAGFSSRGPDSYGIDHNEPDVVAPGVAIMSSVPGGGFGPASGTSMAAPHVTGVVAMMLHKNPALTNDQVLEILTKTAKDLGPVGFDYSYGYGLVQADKAVAETPQGVPPVIHSVASSNDLVKALSVISLFVGIGLAVPGRWLGG
jgi:subtilisin family serine protease